MVSGVQLVAATPSLADAGDVTARCRFVVYQNRVEYEEYFFVGKRTDSLRLVDDRWRLTRREVTLDQNVLLAKNLTVFL